MNKFFFLLTALWVAGFSADEAMSTNLIVGEPACLEVVRELKLPVALEAGDKSEMAANWEQADRVLADLSDALQGKTCRLKFDQVFSNLDTLQFFPLTNRVLASAPQGSLEGLEVHTNEGAILGSFGRRLTVEEPSSDLALRSYTFYFFQYRDQGRYQSTGNRLLRDDFLVRWKDLEDQVAITTE